MNLYITAKFKALLVILILSLSVLLTTPRVSAQIDVTCDKAESWYEVILDMLPLVDIRRTVMNMLVSLGLDGYSYVVFNANIDQITSCASYIANMGCGAEVYDVDTDSCVDAYDATYCQDLMNSFIPGFLFPSTEATAYLPPNSRVSGSLAGLVGRFNEATAQPVPVNLAYYAKDVVARVPFVGTALAQGVNYGFNQPLLGSILGVWKLFRNISYGSLSIIMLVLGFMIMNRRRVDQQTVVNVQYAIPRVIIALVLITFSYPIGATIISLSTFLMMNMAPIVLQAATGMTLETLQNYSPQCAADGVTLGASLLTNTGPGALVLFLLAGTANVLTAGVSFYVVGFAALILFIGMIWLAIKFLFIYFKMVFSIITAPLIFMLGAIPGNDDMTTNWFKQMASHALSLPGMATVLVITYLIAFTVMGDITGGAGEIFGLAGALSGVFTSILLIPGFVMMGIFFANQIPGKIETFIMGEKKRR